MKQIRKVLFLNLFLFAIFSLVTSCSDFALSLQKNKDEVTYNLQISQASNGTVTASKITGISAGEEVILTVTPNQNYKLKNLSVVTLQNKDVAVAFVTKNETYKFTMPASDVTVTPVFTIQTVIEDLSGSQGSPEDNGILYKVEHYLQTLEDLETYELAAIQIKSGEAGKETTAAAKTYAGFNVVAFTQKTILEDGSTVVKIFYNRKTITYTFNPNGGNWDGSTDVKTVTGVYGAEFSVENPLRAGYDFVWDKIIPSTFETSNLDFTAVWTARNDTKYTVKTYEQNIDGSYTLLSISEKIGTTDTTTNITGDSSQTGFDLVINQENINGDGSSIVNVYYNRKLYTIIFETNGGSTIPSQQVFYGATVQMPPVPVKENCSFCNWYLDTTCDIVFNISTVITSDLSLYAFWNSNAITYSFHETVNKLPAATDGTYSTSGEYVLFGDFPQSAKDENITVDESISMKMGNMTVYKGSDEKLYAKVESSYYLVEPIKWRVLSKDQNGKAVLFAEYILLDCEWNVSGSNALFTNSKIFRYLNSTFLNNAFSNSAQEQIEITTIIPDIYKSSDNYLPVNEFATDAKVFLLSRDEFVNIYDFEPWVFGCRIRYATAYASAIGAEDWWWLRSFYGAQVYQHEAFIVENKGDLNLRVVGTEHGGIVPAITVYLPDE